MSNDGKSIYFETGQGENHRFVRGTPVPTPRQYASNPRTTRCPPVDFDFHQRMVYLSNDFKHLESLGRGTQRRQPPPLTNLNETLAADSFADVSVFTTER